MIRRQRAEVVSVLEDCGEVVFVAVRLDATAARAVCYPLLTGAIAVGDEVIVNTMASELKLGSGGYHYVVANLSRDDELAHDARGHIVKLRYTPLQHEVLTLEEPASPHHATLAAAQSLAGMPIIVGTLHSQVAAVAAGIRAHRAAARIVYVMTDSAALPIGFSHLVRQLKAVGLLDSTITAGQAFGGDHEAVNVTSALLAAKVALNADHVIVAPGVGHVGTGTRFGFSGIEQAGILDSVAALRGRGVAVLRISFADARPRHRGVSHHSLTVLGQLTQARATVVAPELPPVQAAAIARQLEPIALRHELITQSGERALGELAARGVQVTTMGRSVEQDREFFLSAGAAGEFAAMQEVS